MQRWWWQNYLVVVAVVVFMFSSVIVSPIQSFPVNVKKKRAFYPGFHKSHTWWGGFHSNSHKSLSREENIWLQKSVSSYSSKPFKRKVSKPYLWWRTKCQIQSKLAFDSIKWNIWTWKYLLDYKIGFWSNSPAPYWYDVRYDFNCFDFAWFIFNLQEALNFNQRSVSQVILHLSWYSQFSIL